LREVVEMGKGSCRHYAKEKPALSLGLTIEGIEKKKPEMRIR